MIKQGSDVIKNIEQSENNPFEGYIGNDLALITILLLIEFAKEDREVVTFNEFTKFLSDKGRVDLNKFDGLHDYMNQCDFILSIIRELDFVKVDKVYFDEKYCLPKLLKYLVRETKDIPDYDVDGFIESFGFDLNYYLGIKQNALNLKFKLDRFEDYGIENFNDCFETEFDKVKGDYLNDLLLYAGESIALSFSFDKNKALFFEKGFNKYFIKEFKDFYGQDDSIFIEEKLVDFKFINGAIRIPLELFNSEDFDVIAILKYLDIKKRVAIKKWGAPSKYWEAKLLKKDLLALFVPNPEAFLKNHVADKINISLDLKAKILTVNNANIDLKKAKFQFDLFEVLMKEKPIDFDLSFSEIAESIDHSYESLGKEGQVKLNKRYSNSSFQLSRKIGFEAGIKNIILMSKNEVRFNPKYKLNFM
ncbi:hypothetical protein COU74_03070 [Candidatus Peregrinibacteria bacterium CG10_big_fil_rev_8_21_14_0_10_36_19]|nr:MAG: hypothetical protein COU74_03070 [Candidatus Peregrinibacteria bacterium CG10_big_fil_rev_8_21_14_0_10_36_19]